MFYEKGTHTSCLLGFRGVTCKIWPGIVAQKIYGSAFLQSNLQLYSILKLSLAVVIHLEGPQVKVITGVTFSVITEVAILLPVANNGGQADNSTSFQIISPQFSNIPNRCSKSGYLKCPWLLFFVLTARSTLLHLWLQQWYFKHTAQS